MPIPSSSNRGVLARIGAASTASDLKNTTALAFINGVTNTTVGAGYKGIFGSGQHKIFTNSGTFTVPAGVDEVRVRLVAAGGGGCGGNFGGAGGGFAMGVFPVTPGQDIAVTVGVAGQGGHQAGVPPTPGGTSSFGSYLSATGGGVSTSATPPTPGQGVGGEINTKGGGGGYGGGGGGAGSQLGDGGAGGWGGGGVVGDGGATPGGGGGGSPFSNARSLNGAADITGKEAIYIGSGAGVDGAVNPINAVIRFPFDGFTGGGGSYSSSSTPGKGGIGGGGGCAVIGGDGGDGGGGGRGISGAGGRGGLGAGGGAAGGSTTSGAPGGPGLVVVEW